MNTRKKITSGILAAAFMLSMTPNISFADRDAGLSSQYISIADTFITKYEMMDTEKREMMSERISMILNNIDRTTNGKKAIKFKNSNGQGREVSATKSQRNKLYDILNYINIEINEFDGKVNVAFSDATDLNLTLQSLLKQHVNVALDTLRLAYDGDAGFDASFDELDKNSVALAETIGSVYGEDAQEEFLELWRAHIGFFADLTIGAKTGDDDMVQEAMDNLDDYKIDAANFFSGAIPSVKYDQVFAGAKEHGKLLTDSMLAYIDGDYEEAYSLQEQADTQIEGLANLLSGGIVEQFPNLFSNSNIDDQNEARMSPASSLRLELNDILREHVNIALNTLRNAYDGKEDFDASFELLDDNSVDLANLIGSVYGDEAEETFLKLWRDHINFFANLTIGAKTGDDDMVQEAMDNLDEYKIDAANFFSGAIPSVKYDQVFEGAKVHGKLLTDSMLAFIDEDYDEAYELQTQADAQIQGLADLLTKGITSQFPDEFSVQ